jgi:hypothetical protein
MNNDEMAGHVAYMGEVKSAYKIWLENPKRT